ncbi:MAG: hypothetical protein LKE20_05075 [Limosilactobacillus oris]|jgi:hypothetical protein|uniref:hypothetical protein n=2 Tax=Limosilactobacillus oris TaxID=1632 RepID=UPI00243047BD|nr:hypothetical protein [Limosilactobacillus oris]MCH3938733.1 hypothetical protein [Limosilactobacillus oris]MCI1980139.1 hypothetical protein [Limosilactobacillus oris]MCI2042897.1 hypothetical protein [Limosilactobacillus oris]
MMKLIKVQTISGETHKLKTTYQEARRPLDHAGTVVLIGTNLNGRRVIIPIASIDSITEVFDDVD